MSPVVWSSCMDPSCLHLACSSNEWTCSDGSCIPQEQRCDNRYDCPDYTDEYECYGKAQSLPGNVVVLLCMCGCVLLSVLQQCSSSFGR